MELGDCIHIHAMGMPDRPPDDAWMMLPAMRQTQPHNWRLVRLIRRASRVVRETRMASVWPSNGVLDCLSHVFPALKKYSQFFCLDPLVHLTIGHVTLRYGGGRWPRAF
jgi:hypothetical protein